MRILPIVVWLVLVATACGGDAAPAASADWQPLADLATLNASQQQQSALAKRAMTALAGSLMSELTQAIADHGAAGALGVCAERAPTIATAVGKEHGVRIGRTSQRLRNPSNTAPAWAAPHLAGNGDAGPQLLAGPHGELGMLSPIRLQPLCTACHGTAEQLAPGVADALRARYPHDQATGFAPGDLRGWFWIEVPRGE